ncbi:MAG: putative DNA binding domain-containing protein [Candidatus Latescibacteria bacterium]|nr:putative DNA binding domain-containing protein [Candidatus Latescibacterota bacterium]
MTKEELKALIEEGEGQLVEFKAFRGGVSPSKIAETIVAFANADGGTILLGIDDDGAITGFRATSGNRDKLMNAARECCSPEVPIKLEFLGKANRTVGILSIPSSHKLHSHVDGRVLLRVGTQDKRLLGGQILQLSSSKSMISHEEELVRNASLDDFDDDVIDEYIARREERLHQKLHLTKVELLRGLGLVISEEERYVPTVAGVLLFGKDPGRFLVQSGITFVRFAGTEPGTGPGNLPGYMRREDINGPLTRTVERVWEIVWEEMRKGGVIKGLVREEVLEYPEFPVREALINAVAHRDYRIAGLRIEVRMFDDRLEVMSPGSLPGHITVENIVTEHFSRNPQMVKVLFHWHYIEELGIGIDRMIREMVEKGGGEPKFVDTGHTFTVILPSALSRVERIGFEREEWAKGLTERQRRAVEFLIEKGKITNREYQQLCKVSEVTALRDLNALIEIGIFKKVGVTGRGIYYVLDEAFMKGS